MANWCNNMVLFIAAPAKLQELETLFRGLAKREAETSQGQVPDFIAEPEGYLHYIRWEHDVLYFETKWVPAIKEIQQIAEHYEVGYTCDYDECSMWVYGQASFIDGVFFDVYLGAEDFELSIYDEEKNAYLFEAVWWNSEEEILELLLDRKRSNFNLAWKYF